MAINCTDVNLIRIHFLHLLLQFTLGAERLVPNIDVIFECERELAVLEIVLGHWQGKQLYEYFYSHCISITIFSKKKKKKDVLGSRYLGTEHN